LEPGAAGSGERAGAALGAPGECEEGARGDCRRAGGSSGKGGMLWCVEGCVVLFCEKEDSSVEKGQVLRWVWRRGVKDVEDTRSKERGNQGQPVGMRGLEGREGPGITVWQSWCHELGSWSRG